MNKICFLSLKPSKLKEALFWDDHVDPISIVDTKKLKELTSVGKTVFNTLMDMVNNLRFLVNLSSNKILESEFEIEDSLNSYIEMFEYFKFFARKKMKEFDGSEKTKPPKTLAEFPKSFSQLNLFEELEAIETISNRLNLLKEEREKRYGKINLLEKFQKEKTFQLAFGQKTGVDWRTGEITLIDTKKLEKEEDEEEQRQSLILYPDQEINANSLGEKTLVFDRVMLPSFENFKILDAFRENYGLSSDKLGSFYRCLMREFKRFPHIFCWVVEGRISQGLGQVLHQELEQMASIIEYEFQFNSLENFSRNIYIQFSYERIKEYKSLEKVLSRYKLKLYVVRSEKIKRLNEIIRFLKLEATTSQRLMAEMLKRLNEYPLVGPDFNEMLDRLEYPSQRNDPDYWKQEKELREKKQRLTKIVAEYKAKYYKMISVPIMDKKKRESFQSINLRHEKIRLRYMFLKEQMDKLMLKQDKLNKERILPKSLDLRNEAARRIQNWWTKYKITKNWRSYQMKLLKPKKKKN